MVNHPTKSAAPYPDLIPSEPDGSDNAPANGAQDEVDWKARAEAAEASNTKLTNDLSSSNGRFNKLRRDVETGALGNDGSSAVLARGMVELAQAIDPEGTAGVATRIKALVSENDQSTAEQRQAARESGYEATMTKLVSDHGLENDPAVKQAADLYKSGKTDSDLRDAVDMVRDAAIAAAAIKAQGAVPYAVPPEKPPVPEVTPEVNPADVNLNPPSGGGLGMPTSGQALLDKDINKMDQDELQAHKAELNAARKRGDFYPNMNFG